MRPPGRSPAVQAQRDGHRIEQPHLKTTPHAGEDRLRRVVAQVRRARHPGVCDHQAREAVGVALRLRAVALL